MFTDQILTPTFIDDLAPAITKLISQKKQGIFHLASPQKTTPYKFANQLISTFTGKKAKIAESKLADFIKRANATPRPIKGGMKVEKIIKIGFTPTTWKSGICTIYKQSVSRKYL